MTPLVSILLPTIRPDLFKVRMAEYAHLDLPWPCEIIVVSDNPALLATPHPMLTLRYITQPRGGNVPATNAAFDAAEGRYVFATNDEVELDPQIFRALVAASDAEEGLWSATQTPYCSNDYYGVFFANCPFGHKRFFQGLEGGFFDPAYRCFYADPDLALRCHASGITVTKVPEAKCTHHCVPGAEGHAANHNAYYDHDQSAFRARWGHLGPWEGDPSLR